MIAALSSAETTKSGNRQCHTCNPSATKTFGTRSDTLHSRRHDFGASSETRCPAPDPCVKIEGWAAQRPCGHRAHQEYGPTLTASCRIRDAPSLPGCGCRASQDFRGAQGTSSSLDYQRMFLDSYRTLKGTRTSLESFFCQNLASVKLMSVCSEMLHDKRRVLQRGATWKALLVETSVSTRWAKTRKGPR